MLHTGAHVYELDARCVATPKLIAPSEGNNHHDNDGAISRGHEALYHDIIRFDAMMPCMRTTVTLEPDVELLVRSRMAERGVSFKRALNDLIRAGNLTANPRPFRTDSVAMGRPKVDLDRALQLAAQLEDDESIRRMRSGA